MLPPEKSGERWQIQRWGKGRSQLPRRPPNKGAGSKQGDLAHGTVKAASEASSGRFRKLRFSLTSWGQGHGVWVTYQVYKTE